MTTALDPTVQAEVTGPAAGGAAAAEDLLAELGGPPKLWRWVGTPLLISGALVALYIWVQGRERSFVGDQALAADMIRQRFVEHLNLTGVSTLFVILIAVPLGAMLTRPTLRRLSPIFLGVANVGQAVPSLGVLVILALAFGIGFRYAVIALVLYATLPVLRNTMVGLDQVDPTLIEAARGMGLTSLQVLRRIELPLAVPVMLAGIRTALVINVGTATLATYVNAGGLGWIIDQGIRNFTLDIGILVTGAVLTAALALGLDWLAGIVEDVLRPRGL
jgi:osmoprotectant transport system permease protein